MSYVNAYVNVYVGRRSKHYYLNRNSLSQHSRYLHETQVDLSTEDPKVFELLLDWIHHGSSSLDSLEQIIHSKELLDRSLIDGCRLFCELYCLWFKLKLVKDEGEVREKILRILRHGDILRLEPRTIRMVLEKLPEESRVLQHLLQEVAEDLVGENGHGYDYYAELLEGPNAVPGLVRALFIRMRRPRPLIGPINLPEPSRWFDGIQLTF